MTVETLNIGAVLMAVGISIALAVMAITGRLPRHNGEMHRLGDLEVMVRVLQEDHVRDAQKIEQLSKALTEAQERIRFLESQLAQYRTDKADGDRPAKPLLLAQCNALFGEDDAQALRRTGIPFHRLANATSVDFDRYLQACRQDGTTPWWVVISAHMGPAGVQFADGVKGVNWLSQRIRGVRVLMLAGCENEEVAAQLVGSALAKHVIVIYEKIDTVNAQDLAFAFWSRIWCGAAVPDAFAGALEECPQVSEFVQMRTARG